MWQSRRPKRGSYKLRVKGRNEVDMVDFWPGMKCAPPEPNDDYTSDDEEEEVKEEEKDG